MLDNKQVQLDPYNFNLKFVLPSVDGIFNAPLVGNFGWL